MTAARAGRPLSGVRAAAYRRLAGGYASDPVGYALDVLGADPTDAQRRVAAALTRPPYRVLIPSANNQGKTWLLSWLANWHHDSHDPGVVLATAATHRQVKNQLFKEVRAVRPFGLDLKPRAPEVWNHAKHFALGFSTNKADAFQGHHEGALLLIFDEATGVPGEFWDRAETMFQGEPGHGWVCAYNPNDPTTAAYAAEQGGGWSVVRLNALEHPNVSAELRGEPPPVPSAVRLHRVRERIGRECEDCGAAPADDTCFRFPDATGRDRWYKPLRPEFEAQVLGRWPSRAVNAVWADAEWSRCLAVPQVDPAWPVQVGCDVARYGSDKTAFAVRHGIALAHLETASGWSSRQVADRLRALCERYAPPGVSPREVPCCVDDTGGYGAGVVDHPDGYWFVGVNAAEAARDPSRYPNKRSELWFTTKLAAEGGGLLAGACRDGRHLLDSLRQEFAAARYSLDRKGRRVVEGKDGMKERLRRSPDLADGVNLAWYPLAG